MNRQIVVGIDASNIRYGGGKTHLVELLRAADCCLGDVERVVVWAGKSTLDSIEDRPWLEKRCLKFFSFFSVTRSFWQVFLLQRAMRSSGCDILLSPGGNFRGSFSPFVAISQNLLPFDLKELKRFGFSFATLRLFFLRRSQTATFRNANGVVFLTKFAKNSVLNVTGDLRSETVVIPHGISRRFFIRPREQKKVQDLSEGKCLKILYVSVVNQYKHQWNVVEGVSLLRRLTGWPLKLQLVGPAYGPSKKRLVNAMRVHDPGGCWVECTGPIPYGELSAIYKEADLAVWASTCETFGLILLEAMAAGLPIASSNHGTCKEILGETGVFFDPENPESICSTLKQLIEDSNTRTKLAQMAFERAHSYDWNSCAMQTLRFIESVYLNYYRRRGVDS